jgi:hypothetical protein
MTYLQCRDNRGATPWPCNDVLQCTRPLSLCLAVYPRQLCFITSYKHLLARSIRCNGLGLKRPVTVTVAPGSISTSERKFVACFQGKSMTKPRNSSLKRRVTTGLLIRSGGVCVPCWSRFCPRARTSRLTGLLSAASTSLLYLRTRPQPFALILQHHRHSDASRHWVCVVQGRRPDDRSWSRSGYGKKASPSSFARRSKLSDKSHYLIRPVRK